MSERVVARDRDGTDVRVGDQITCDGETVTVVRRGRYWDVCEELICTGDEGEDVVIYISKFWRRVPTPQADEGEVRGSFRVWLDEVSDFLAPEEKLPPILDANGREIRVGNRVRLLGTQTERGTGTVYSILPGGLCVKVRFDTGIGSDIEGIKQSARDLVVIAPTKDVPGPAGCERCCRCQVELIEECCFETPAGLICADCATAKATQPAAVGAVTCAECGVPETASAELIVRNGKHRCVYCNKRTWRAENVQGLPHRQREINHGIAVAPAEDEEPEDAQWSSATWES